MNDKAFIHAILASYQKGLRADPDRGLTDKRAYYARLNKQREVRDNLILIVG